MHELFVQALGFVATAFCIGSYQIKSSRGLMICKTLGDTIYIVHYLMLNSYSGVVTMFFCALSGLFCSFKGAARWANWKGWRWLFSSLLIIACLFAWRTSFQPVASISSLISMLAVILTTWTGNGRTIRLGKLVIVGPAWLIYSISVGSWSGVINELIGMGSSAISVFRYGLKELDNEKNERGAAHDEDI